MTTYAESAPLPPDPMAGHNVQEDDPDAPPPPPEEEDHGMGYGSAPPIPSWTAPSVPEIPSWNPEPSVTVTASPPQLPAVPQVPQVPTLSLASLSVSTTYPNLAPVPLEGRSVSAPASTGGSMPGLPRMPSAGNSPTKNDESPRSADSAKRSSLTNSPLPMTGRPLSMNPSATSSNSPGEHGDPSKRPSLNKASKLLGQSLDQNMDYAGMIAKTSAATAQIKAEPQESPNHKRGHKRDQSIMPLSNPLFGVAVRARPALNGQHGQLSAQSKLHQIMNAAQPIRLHAEPIGPPPQTATGTGVVASSAQQKAGSFSGVPPSSLSPRGSSSENKTATPGSPQLDRKSSTTSTSATPSSPSFTGTPGVYLASNPITQGILISGYKHWPLIAIGRYGLQTRMLCYLTTKGQTAADLFLGKPIQLQVDNLEKLIKDYVNKPRELKNLMLDDFSLQAVATVLRNYMTRLDPVFPVSHFMFLLNARANQTRQLTVASYAQAVDLYPFETRIFLTQLFRFLAILANNTSQTNLTAQSLAQVWAPVLLRAGPKDAEQAKALQANLPSVIELFIEEFAMIFAKSAQLQLQEPNAVPAGAPPMLSERLKSINKVQLDF